MWLVLTVLLGLLLASLVAVLVLPLCIEFRAIAGETFHYDVALRPLGRVGPRISVANRDKPPKKRANRKKKSDGPRRRSNRLQDPRQIIRAATRLFSEITGQLHVTRAEIDLRFGANDPAETGEIYGLVTPLIYGTRWGRRLDLNLVPVFDGAVFEGSGALDVTMTPARLIPPFVRFGWTIFRLRK